MRRSINRGIGGRVAVVALALGLALPAHAEVVYDGTVGATGSASVGASRPAWAHSRRENATSRANCTAPLMDEKAFGRCEE